MTHDLKEIIAHALAEDIGAGDITSQLLIPDTAQAEMVFAARERLVACGSMIPAMVYAQLDPAVQVEALVREGQALEKGDVLVKMNGAARVLLTGERVALNLMQRMSGVATVTRAYAQAVSGTKAVILDTRKTMPGLRSLDKYAVTVGGGQNHRMRLDDMVLIKDNHIALCGGVAAAIAKARAGTGLPIVVECDTLAQLAEILDSALWPERVLLDNMPVGILRHAVAMAAGRIKLEASGGVSLDTVGAIAQTGVDYISVGKLTHSTPAADIGADIVIA